MKRIVSCLLAVILIFSLCMKTWAEPGTAGSNLGSGDETSLTENEIEEKEEKPQAGGIAEEEDDTNAGDDPGAGDTLDTEGNSGADQEVKDPENENDRDGSGPEDEDKTEDEDAEDEDSEDEDSEDVESEEEEEEPENRRTGNKGQVDVTILSAFDMQGAVDFTVSLTGQGSRNVTLESDPGEESMRAPQADVTFEQLEAGNYVLTVEAPGFAAFSQEIVVEDWAYAVTLTTGMVSGFDEGRPHPGILLWGDVDGNGTIDDMDRDMLVDAIDAGERNPEMQSAALNGNLALDLNRNGQIDLADLEYFAKGYRFSGDTSSTVLRKVPADAVAVSPDKDTAVTGDLEALLKNEGSVVLKPAGGGTISSNTPVCVEFEFGGKDGISMAGMVFDTGNGDPISKMVATVEYIEGTIEEKVDIPFDSDINFLLDADTVHRSQDKSGAICIDFGMQIAVKKVTLKIMGMRNNNNLAEISKVEFLNDMAERIPEPEMNIPEKLSAKAGNKSFTLNWDPCVNITGYEVRITSGASGEEVSETVMVKGNTVQITSFGKEKLKNNTTYKAAVQSVNGAWRSGYSEAVEATPKADKKPDAPDNLKLTGAYKAISAAWKKMDNTDTYNLYYRESGKGSFTKVEKIPANSYTITGLKDKTSYEVYVTGVNELGESKPSLTGKAETVSPDPAQMPRYKLINYAEAGEVSGHIIDAYFGKGMMKESTRDTAEEKTAWGTVDNDPVSYYLLNSWDSGGFNPMGEMDGQTYEFDQAYKLQDIALQEVAVQSPAYGYARVKYWDESGTSKDVTCSVQRKTDSEKRVYYMLHLDEAITAKKIQIGLARAVAFGTITCSEIYFYHYDTLEDEIMALYTNDLHTELRSDVTQDTIDKLREKVNTPDEVSKEYHPNQEKLERELKTAEDILNAKQLNKTVEVHNSITTDDLNRGFGGLNAWQPLGVSAAAGEEITVYVGHNKKKTGDSTNLQLIATQYHAEASAMFSQAVNLKIGRNDITVPKISSIDAESGGALYIQYTGNHKDDHYGVRVNGGAEVPVLDLYQVTDRNERVRLAEAYLKELKEHVDQMPARHEKLHQESKLGSVKYDYAESECILGASDIMMDTMLLSLPASQILKGSGNNAETIVSSVEAMEKMMHLFYQHKGLTTQSADENNVPVDRKDTYPSRHLNIRYQRMFAGAFMYASGNHIGIEWGSTPGMVSAAPVVSDADGKYVSGRYFGWGIAHEIGHCINQGSYAVAEVTNNYFSVLAQAQDNNGSVRFKYDEVYKKVTSGTKGHSSNVFTQLGLYWQLHLAYDNGYNFKTYENYNDQLRNLFFARVDTYARTPSKAPGNIKLELSGDSDQNLMRLSCAAAEKNLLEFFERWGMTPDEGTAAYAKQFEEETRAIYYVNDEARVYRLTNPGSSLNMDGSTQAVNIISEEINAGEANRVDLKFSSSIPSADILGYEIVRCMRSGGGIQEEVAGFTTSGSFSDYVTTVNNRVVKYKVTVIDKYLNRSAPAESAELKIQHDGSIDKAGWTAAAKNIDTTVKARNGIGTGSESEEELGTGAGTWDQDTICGPAAEDPIKHVLDNSTDTVYTGRAGEEAEIVLEFHKTHTVTGFKYTPAQGYDRIKDYSISVRKGGQWEEVAAGTFQSEDAQIVYFGNDQNSNLHVYQTTAVKLQIKNQAGREIGIAELDVLGVTGDDVDFRRTAGEDTPVIGRLKEDFSYGGGVIPAGSLVFTGVYKGNPAYNVVILYDQNGEIVGGVDTDGSLNASQIILADVPDTGQIQDVSDGSWVYWIEPKHMIDLTKLTHVRAELYRVDDASENTGQRLVSDSKFEEMPAQSLDGLPEIQLQSSVQKGSRL